MSRSRKSARVPHRTMPICGRGLMGQRSKMSSTRRSGSCDSEVVPTGTAVSKCFVHVDRSRIVPAESRAWSSRTGIGAFTRNRYVSRFAAVLHLL
jgi:hypothetical protein